MAGAQSPPFAIILSRPGDSLVILATEMKAWRQRLVGSTLLILLTATRSLMAAPDMLNWNQRQGRVDADISSWDTLQLLEHVAAATGWQVYLDPGAVHNISAKFKDL